MAESEKSYKQVSRLRAKKSEGDLSSYVFGKVQPQAIPLEEAVLGALMLDKDSIAIVIDILRSDSFYSDAHQLIFKSIIRLFERSQPVDILTVTEELKKAGDLDKVGGSFYLVGLTNRVASAANIEFHARIIAQKHIQRELIKVSTNVIRDAYEDTTDVFQLLDDAEQGLFNITQQNLSRSYESMGTLASKALKQLEEMASKEAGLTGVPTGFTDLDRMTSGWQSSDLIIMAARPGMGKTSLTLALAKNAAMDFGKGVAFFSLEMSNVQLVQRLISLEAEISGSKLRSGQLEDYEWKQLHSVIEKMSEVPIFIDDTPGINIFELRAKCRRLKMQHDIQMVIIDYLQFEQRIFPIGRLDKNSTGLLMLTNDGDIVNDILRKENRHEKEYVVTVDQPITPAFLQRMAQPIPMLGTKTLPCKVIQLKKKVFKIILTQGLNRQIRRMCEYCGYKVMALKRIRIMHLKLGRLKTGAWRYLTKEEIRILQQKRKNGYSKN